VRSGGVHTLYYGAAGGEGDFCVDWDKDQGGCGLEEVKELSGDAVLWAERDPRTLV
jgi:hypothetical protein